MKTEIPEQLKSDVPQTTWGRILTATPVVMAVVATMLAGLASSEMTKAQYDRSLAAQQQSKAGDQWSYFQAKRLRGSQQRSTLDLLQSIVNTGDTASFFNAWAVFEPPINLKTGKPYGYDSQAFTGAYAEFQMLNPGKEICSQSEIDLAEKMIKELRFGNKHLSADINFMIKHGHAERSHFVEYQGAFFKFRTDLETPSKIVDWKTCQFEVPKPENWSKQVVKMGYDISAAFYQFFCFISTGIWKPFYWVAQEKEPPFDFNIIDASNWAYEVNLKTQEVIPHTGALKFRKLLDAYMECYHKDDWPGYSVFTLPQIYQGKEKRIATAPVPGYESSKSVFFYL